MTDERIRVCWGTPDTVYYIDKDDKEHEIDLSPWGYTFGIWDGVCITSSDRDDSCGLCHDDLIIFYVWEHGWGDAASPREAYNCSWEDIYDLPIRYYDEIDEDFDFPKCIYYRYNDEEDTYDLKIFRFESDNEDNYDEYDEHDLYNYCGISESMADDVKYDMGEDSEDGWKVLDYTKRETYGDLLHELGDPVLRGRILMDFDTNNLNPPSFISFWDENDITSENIKKLADEWGSSIYDYLIVTETNEKDATKYGIFNMPTLSEWMNGETAYKGGVDDNKEKERLFNIHLGKPEEKEKYFQNFKQLKDKKILDKLGSMPMAKYHDMIYAENIKKKFNTILERISKNYNPNRLIE